MEAYNTNCNHAKKPRKPLQMIAKLFNKGKRTTSVPQVNVDSIAADDHEAEEVKIQKGPDISDLVFVDSELEALHISRTDNPYLQVLCSQDNLDTCTGNDPMSSSVMMSPDSISPTRSYAGRLEYSLTEIHSRLVRSPPPVTWPLSPRSTGTFSPDSSDGMMDLDNPAGLGTMMISQPTRGYSPYNRSHSEEHILSPCRELLKSEFSPGRGTTPELLAVSMTAAAGGSFSPYRDYDVRSERRSKPIGPTASFSSSTRQQHFSGTTASLRNYNSRAQHNRSSNFYYTMNYSQDGDLDEEALLSPNRNQLPYQFGARSSRRSVGGLSFSPMNMSMTCGQSSAHGQQPQHHKSSAGGFFASWRRSYRMRSKSTASSAHNNVSRKQDTKSMENLLNNRTPRYSVDMDQDYVDERMRKVVH